MAGTDFGFGDDWTFFQWSPVPAEEVLGSPEVDHSDPFCPIENPWRHFLVDDAEGFAPTADGEEAPEEEKSNFDMELKDLDTSLSVISDTEIDLLMDPENAKPEQLALLTDEELGEFFGQHPHLADVCDETFWWNRLQQNHYLLFKFATKHPGSITFTWKGLYNQSVLLPSPFFHDYCDAPFEVFPENLVHPVVVRFLDSLDNFCFSRAVFQVCKQNPKRVEKYSQLNLRLVNHAELLDECARESRTDIVSEFAKYGYFPSKRVLKNLLKDTFPKRWAPFLLRILQGEAEPKARHVLDFWTGTGRQLIVAILEPFSRLRGQRSCLKVNPYILKEFERLNDRQVLRLVRKYGS